ncbi:hypothetical protein O6H91_03G085100 [Diphasiastrum complanatum]|uniref:Uncharacterized protein n=5 Tax=Diphasiastrum complanatum TaxID=34168 RepID=A0ACC2E964_DIPCM|nr:hypothetical protein O6H91_03G085100 [Diphasiastrum complanatum]KAJ7562814.1 hypothetical protein O6H91_03G085100 [Diphasiastrum complanatum]KAJ7562815.1 hypothetical protein O6H91_03G085100 [Diphasiastrum complanatum]KAJ7562817.1 hypothetical protein O6H91_03G085100 [Diphasiastrum complanatum]KAJ7562818.1 hypothetical protein O6H91_03G085100 [Diphasiastrum complanatum]
MVGFGKHLRELQIPEWANYYISYKMMKKKVKQYARLAEAKKKENRQQVLKEFSGLLDRQIEKIVLFLLEKQGQLALRLASLGDEREATERQGDINRKIELRDAYRSVGKDLLKLLYFVEVNATGLRKILKKFDKHAGYSISDYYVATRSNHPYSQLQQVFRHVGIGAMVGAISRNLAELHEQRDAHPSSIYDYPPSFPLQEPIIQSIKAAEERLTNSTSFLEFIGKHALILRDEFPRPLDEVEGEEHYHFMSLVLNLVNTYLYMVNTYIIVPTADKYAMSLGAAPTLCGMIIGSMAVAQLVSSVYFSAWSNRSYFRPLIFSSLVLLLGNILYAIAYDLQSLPVLLIGRLLCGFGSARAVNRRYISDCVPLKSRLKASAAFVSASALGMASGPALAGFLEFEIRVFGLTFNGITLPGWVMAASWLLYLIWLSTSFHEPIHDMDIEQINGDQALDTADRVDQDRNLRKETEAENGLLQPLLCDSELGESGITEECDIDRDNDDDSEDSSKPANNIVEAYRLLTMPVKVQLLIYFMLKYAMEILLSESSVVTSFYFGWNIRHVAVFLALLGLTVLPVNAIVGTFLSNICEDRQILLISEIFTCLGVLVSFKYGPVPYTPVQYVSGALLIFVSAEVLEGVNLSLLSKVMSSRLARGTYNGGLLSTEAGTLARVLADTTITLVGYLGEAKLLNTTLFPTLFIGILTVLATLGTYNSMF